MLFSKSDKLFKVIDSGNTEEALSIIRKIKNIDCRDKNGNTPLLISCGKGSLTIVRELLDSGAEVNAVNSDNETPALIAAKTGHIEYISHLIDHNADINIKDRSGYGVLHAAAGFGHLAMVEILLPMCREKDSPDIFGNTPLLYAAMYGHNNIVEFLLESGASAGTQNVNGSTPLLEAAAGGHTFAAKTRRQYGESADIPDNEWLLPHKAAYNNEHYELSELISQSRGNGAADSSSKEPGRLPGFIKTAEWLDLNLGKNVIYAVMRQTLVGEIDSRDEGKHEYSGILKKDEKEYYVFSESLNSRITIDGFQPQCPKKSQSLKWNDYRTHGVFLEKSVTVE